MSPARGANLMRHHHHHHYHQHPVALFRWPVVVVVGGGIFLLWVVKFSPDYTQVRMHAGSDGLR